MSATRPKTNVEVVNEFVSAFVANTKHLLDAKLEPPLVKPNDTEWNKHFTLGKSDEELIKADYAHHAAAALHFIIDFAKTNSVWTIWRNVSLLTNRLLFLQAFYQGDNIDVDNIRHSFTPRVVDKNSRLLASEFLVLVNNVAALNDPYDGFLNFLVRPPLELLSKSATGRNLVDDLKHYFKILTGSLEHDIAAWDKRHPQNPGSTGAVMTLMPELRLAAAAAPPAAQPQPSVNVVAALPAPPKSSNAALCVTSDHETAKLLRKI